MTTSRPHASSPADVIEVHLSSNGEQRVNDFRVLVVGAGLGGLVAALALRREGFQVDVYEQTAVLGEVGAGLSLSLGAQDALSEVGVLDAVRSKASVTRHLARLHYKTGQLLSGAVDDSDGTSADPPGATVPTGLQIHRADLHEILLSAVRACGAGIHLNRRYVHCSEREAGVAAHFSDGSQAVGDVLIGADGLRSEVRAELWGREEPRWTGQVAFRSVLPTRLVAPLLGAGGRAAVYYGPGRTFNRYTLRRGAILNCVGIARTDSWEGEGWTTPASRDELSALYEGWHGDLCELIDRLPDGSLMKWALFDREPLSRWRQGAVTLLGDAAHPMLPFLGLGAAMAIEDGLALARALTRDPGPVGLDAYEELRRPRTTEVMLASRLEGQLVQGRDPSELTLGEIPSFNRRFYESA